MTLEKRSGFHLDNKVFMQCSMGSNRHTTRTMPSSSTKIEEGFIFYSNTKSPISLEVIHPSKFKSDKTLAACQFTLDKFLAKPRATRLRARATLTKPGSSEIIGTVDYSVSIHADPYSV
uniref:Uncharacterized protein n=1 Tax=Vannella robusta TaxID=1487602 RepID=A0A7S4MQN9_9EUKA|mmetsp:Transcript_6975/g.8667  ORF Transcript_6975/g.8667 Transcript_6975/m.8667 type:complete len:119 (+) Transcript_6975:3-359(+)